MFSVYLSDRLLRVSFSSQIFGSVQPTGEDTGVGLLRITVMRSVGFEDWSWKENKYKTCFNEENNSKQRKATEKQTITYRKPGVLYQAGFFR